MALIFMDGFDAGDYAERWAPVAENQNTVIAPSLQTGRFGTGNALRLDAAGSGAKVGLIRFFQTATTVYFGGAMRVNGVVAIDEVPLVHFGGFGGYGNIGLWLTGSMGLTVWRQANTQPFTTSSGTALASASEGIIEDEWTYLEMMVTTANSGGRVIVRKNGNIIVDFTGDTISGTTITGTDSIQLGTTQEAAMTVDWDDVYICNNTGSTNNDFLGDVEVKALQPSANGTYSDFGGSDGNSIDNYQLVDDTNTSDYVTSGTVGQRDSYNLPNLSGVDVKAVQTVMQGVQTESGLAGVRPFLRIGGTNYPTSTQYLGQQTITTYPLDVSPATTSAWSAGEVSGAELGIEVV